ncbi:Uncharacterized oxidoreductase SAV2478 [Phocoenobacter uteri]|uniref:Uncharacterized oxidoreductase SAV2478 n=1 Tax=Phocoenobacter uteri TaxID=146806 RepID=A0A379CBE9_9PAST|nr:SDR family oxidoreductase [Phocoenobacter uteri]MDG6881008.1 hypothetical protein [Phocoenobacter uteri]SUB59026.1 Uncharacterized oxidoreductase SAV2478 [Phocoenobacter uteri]
MNTTKVALITGATGGIGKVIVQSLAQQGYNLILTARNEQKLALLRQQIIKNYGVECNYVANDLCNVETFEQLDQQIRNFDRLDVVINCAGIFLDDHNSTNLSQLFATNVIACQKICDLCIPYMKKQQSGYIFNIASITGVKAYKNIANYCASKHALVGYSLSLAKTLKADGIKVSVICPDVVESPMSQSSTLTPEQKIQPDDIAKAIDFLLSLSASASIEQLTIGR